MSRIFTLILSAFLLLGANTICCSAFPLQDKIEETQVEEVSKNNIQDIIYDEESKRQLIEEMNESVTTRPRVHSIDESVAKSPYQRTNTDFNAVPKLHGEFFDVIFRFIKVMIAVAVASVVIYFLLLLVRKFYGEKLQEKYFNEDENLDLRTPKNDTTALRGFLNQTKNRQD